MRYFASLLVVLSAAVLQAQEPVHQAALKAWADDFAGQWISDLVLQEDAGPLKKGMTFTGHHAYEWSPDKEALFMKYWGVVDGKTFSATKGIVGWDASKKAVVVKWFNALGECGELSYVRKDREWSITWTSVNSEGKQTVAGGSITLKGDAQRIHTTPCRSQPCVEGGFAR
jgi:hypothetical protein